MIKITLAAFSLLPVLVAAPAGLWAAMSSASSRPSIPCWGGPGEDATRWTGRLTRKGTYIIAIGSTHGNANFSMDVKIE